MLVAARLRHIAASTWSERKYLNMDLLIGLLRRRISLRGFTQLNEPVLPK